MSNSSYVFHLKMQQWCIHFTTNKKKNVKLFSHLLVHAISLLVYVVHTVTRKWDIKFKRAYYIIYSISDTNGYPWVRTLNRALSVGKILYFYPYPRIKFHTHTLTYRIGYSHPLVKLQSPVADSDPLCRTVSMHCSSCCSRKVCTVVSTVYINELFMSRWIRTHSHSSLFRESREPLLFLREFVRDPCVWMLPLPSPPNH